MLYLVGLGLGDAKDITVKGLEIVKNADFVFLEAHTSVLFSGQQVLVRKWKNSAMHQVAGLQKVCISFASYFKITRDCALNYAWFFKKEFLIFRNPAPHSK